MSIEKDEFRLLHIVSFAVKEMSEGELLQQEKSRLLNITEEVYYTIIRQKTASLIAACCESGAAAAGADDEAVKNMHLFGLNVGLAFQVKDDLFDYGFGKDIGKPTGIDIQEKKMTLPLIYALQQSDKKERAEMINIVKRHNTDSEKVKSLVARVIEKGGVDYAMKKMEFFRDEALKILAKFPDSEAKTSLHALVDYTINRDK
jgi:octaprenyl-diphosphate synthase